MKKVLNIYKPLGLTTARALKEFKRKNSEYENVPLAYTGRLDPMAEGVLVVLAGKERYNAEKYQKLDKEYLARILFGFSTDSYDLLGIVKKENFSKIRGKDIERALKEYEGKTNLSLPPYSSYRIRGKPMFHLEREGDLKEEEIPERQMVVKSAKLEDFYCISSAKLHEYIKETIGKIEGNFRQEEIISNWNKIFEKEDKNSFPIAEIKFKVSGGTYIRSIARNLGKKLETEALLYHLKRTEVEKFTSEKSILLY